MESDFGSADADIAEVNASNVKQQAVGNCWVYATVSWAETLHRLRTNEKRKGLDISESYLTYWDWYEKLLNSPSLPAKLEPAAHPSNAMGLMQRYGLMGEGAFLPEEATSAEAEKAKVALETINESLKNGPLNSLASIHDPLLVRGELNRAWELAPYLIEELDNTFGADGKTTLETGKALPSRLIRSTASLEVAYVSPEGETVALPLSDAIGEKYAVPSIWSKGDGVWGALARSQHEGEHAWQFVGYPLASGEAIRRETLRRIQRSLHNKMPVILLWQVDRSAMDAAGAFRKNRVYSKFEGGHVSVIDDYEADNVPGFGTLRAGSPATPEAMEAALSDEAQVKFLRIKNSWGTGTPDPQGLGRFTGFNDLYLDYLTAWELGSSPPFVVLLPPGY